jgi:hypothetical protein
MAGFTPGRWQVEHGRSHNPMVGTADVTVAEVLDDVFPDTAQQMANAHLIAAAPAMYGELERLIAWLRAQHLCPQAWCQADAAQAVLDVATGAY